MTDKELIISYLKGEEKSFEVLVKKYINLVFSFSYKHTDNVQDAEDIIQETFLRAWRNIKKFDLNRDFKVWIITIAKNASIDMKKKKRSIAYLNEDKFIDFKSLPEELINNFDANRMINSAFKKISPKYQNVLSLYYEKCLNFREIADYLGESINTVKSRHRRALIDLRKIIS